MDIKSLIQQLREPGVRAGIGVWFMPQEYLGEEIKTATQLDIQPLDAREAYLKQLPPNAKFSGLTRPDGHQRLLHLLRQSAEEVHHRDCLLVHTLDLLLLGLEVDEREHFWHGVLGGVPYPRTKLVLTIPENASELFKYNLFRRYEERIAKGNIPS